jgi:hypothetical protein
MNPDLSRLTPAKLVEAELEGKFKAIAGYDDILWKIRAGYLAVVYGRHEGQRSNCGSLQTSSLLGTPHRSTVVSLRIKYRRLFR